MSSVSNIDKKYDNSQNCRQLDNLVKEIFTYGKSNILRLFTL